MNELQEKGPREMNKALPVVDELMTDGCPNCVVKHLSAALASLAVLRSKEFEVPVHEIIAAQALINLAEAAEGYTSHRDFAIGLLALAEMHAYDYELSHKYPPYPTYKEYRGIRVSLMTGDDSAAHGIFKLTTHEALFAAHLLEAEREMPGVGLADFPEVPFEMSGDWTAVRYANLGQVTVDRIRESIDKIRKEFFAVPTEGEAEVTNKGETTMMKKAKCAPGKCAADKGGKTAKGAQADCKGGKCKPGKACKK